MDFVLYMLPVLIGAVLIWSAFRWHNAYPLAISLILTGTLMVALSKAEGLEELGYIILLIMFVGSSVISAIGFFYKNIKPQMAWIVTGAYIAFFALLPLVQSIFIALFITLLGAVLVHKQIESNP